MRLLILSLIPITFIAAAPTKNADPAHILNKKIPLFIFSNEDEFFLLCHTLRIPCGEEKLPNQRLIQTDDYGRRQERVAVRVLLDKMLKRRPGYLWEISGGVLILRPRSPGQSSPLEKHIHQFIRKSEDPWSIINELARLEMIDIPQPAPFAGAGVSLDILMNDSTARKKIDVTCMDQTVRQILNTVVYTHGHSMWIYTYTTPTRFLPAFWHRGKLESYVF